MSATAFEDDENLQRILAAIREETEPERVYLFGSRARGEHDEESDYDLFVIANESRNSRELQRDVSARLGRHRLAFDVFVSSAEQFAKWAPVANTLPCLVQETGVRLDG